ncbi:alpha/beta hydrolase [Pseudomonas sp. 6D_7.1_Bac1]|uniref:alpha/beta hydrolase n=1 Tax=Pseudomonas sp. 6D_7.1_Bac1 TaxID=2971615 RepID=UPI0021C7AE88|nr:alpha/beta hydrolase [Pseudomonas sp. 6D_7.1_Bac1]MCU1752744.1 alpha/beta hydrolase [Pseudomonas sp. 6D_7.1_Bac1]
MQTDKATVDIVDPYRRTFLGASAVVLSGVAVGGAGLALPAAASVQPTAASQPTVIGYPDRKGVHLERVTFPNTAANTLVAGNLFKPAGMDSSKRYAAIVVGHPFGGVKEQTSGLHAQKLAELGYVALAFDASHWGDSRGEPRNTEVPSTRVGDYSACIDFLSNHPQVDAQRIGVLGICGGGGYAVSAAQIDHRIKAIATVSMYDMGRARRQGLGDTLTYEQRMKILDDVAQQRTKEARGEPRRDISPIPTEIDANTPKIVREFYDYYLTPRGQHPHANNLYAFTSLAPMMNFFPFAQIETISPRPLLMIVGENAESAYFSQDAFSKAVEPKELFVVPGATHVDLYDRPAYTQQSIEKLNAFFTRHLA